MDDVESMLDFLESEPNPAQPPPLPTRGQMCGSVTAPLPTRGQMCESVTAPSPTSPENAHDKRDRLLGWDSPPPPPLPAAKKRRTSSPTRSRPERPAEPVQRPETPLSRAWGAWLWLCLAMVSVQCGRYCAHEGAKVGEEIEAGNLQLAP
jgi:hypothetical protein